IKNSTKPEGLNAYLTNYPNGQFRSLALSRIASLESGPKPDATRNLSTGIDPATFKEEADQTTEDQIGLDKGQRRDVQRRLTGLGFDTKATGQFDQATRGVITRWQAARGDLFAGGLSQGLVDAVLPAGTALLEMFQHILIDAQRDQFPHAGKRGRLRWRFRHLGGGALERRLGVGTRVVQGSRPPWLVRHC